MISKNNLEQLETKSPNQPSIYTSSSSKRESLAWWRRVYQFGQKWLPDIQTSNKSSTTQFA